MAEKKVSSPSGVLRFGIFQANLPARELRKHGVRVRLPGQPFFILSMLLEKPGEVVTRDEMRQQLWGSDTFVDFEHSLNSAIKKLRTALGDSSENSRYIETIPRLGYRFIAPVETSAAEAVKQVDIGAHRTRLPMSGLPASLSETVTPRSSSAFIRKLDTDRHLWAKSYDREFKDVLALQGEIALDIVKQTQGNASSQSMRTSVDLPPVNASAYEAYLKGRYFWNKRTPEGFKQAVESFQQAIAKDPNYARAYSGLADTYALISSYSLAPPDQIIPKAHAAAFRALQIDERLAEAHASLALVTENYNWDWQTAEKEYQRAIELDPNYATAHHWYAEYLGLQGRFDQALTEMQHARLLDPLSLIMAIDNAAILYYARQYDRAIEQYRAVLAMEPGFGHAHIAIAAYVEKRQFANALAEIDRWRRSKDGPWIWGYEAYVHGRAGQMARARYELKKFQETNRRWKSDPAGMLALAYTGMGNKDEAFAWLQKALAEHSIVLLGLKVDPAYDPLRSDPRFQDLLRRVGLARAEEAGKLRVARGHSSGEL